MKAKATEIKHKLAEMGGSFEFYHTVDKLETYWVVTEVDYTWNDMELGGGETKRWKEAEDWALNIILQHINEKKYE